MPKFFRFVFLANAVALCCALPIQAGVVYEIETTDHRQSPPKVESVEMVVEGKLLKMGLGSSKGDQGDEMIFRGDRREIIVVDHANEVYHVIDQEMAQNLGSQIDSALEQARKALENVPEDQRAMVEQLLKDQMLQEAATGPKAEVKKGKKKGTHLGHTTRLFEVWIDGRMEDELWILRWDRITGGEEVADVMLELSEFYGDLIDSFGQFGGGGGSPLGGGDFFFEHLRELEGFPVVSKDFAEDGSLESEATLRSAERRALDPAAFEPPMGYKRQEMFNRR